MGLITYKEWTLEDKISAAICYMRYPELSTYLEKVEYLDEHVAEGKEAYKKAKKIYLMLSTVFTDSEIEEMGN